MLATPQKDAPYSWERKYPVERLPNPRPRALTIPLSEDVNNELISDNSIDVPRNLEFSMSVNLDRQCSSKSGKDITSIQQTHDQQQSPLCRLPYEIRLIVWKYCLSGFRWHIAYHGSRLIGIECTEDHSWLDLSEYVQKLSIKKSGPARMGPVGRVPILLSCRLIYSDTVPLLYANNIFDFQDGYVLPVLANSILPSRLNLIRTVKMHTSYHTSMSREETSPEIYRDWKRLCSVLSEMKGLENLFILIWTLRLYEGGKLDAILGPLANIKAKVLEIFLPDRATWQDEDLPPGLIDRPCLKIMRRKSEVSWQYGQRKSSFDDRNDPMESY
ncbi:hypothetical protein P175DRAFT_0498507 [Aspergillus ochraceoroseus IBT 24754]|uniref:DUF7730 domain-containing protein n=1 Tax=Aspergillus ochraceoroseus IBT 24754 TaxID=1392256 RepID=A0A2T5MA31_9EURO|nr:uncharacterized protein P175DRAFT_0498507 [Aspergillus ochraceoroseus IBT 24754]PTU25387.1 hypothetical protein P175DRAFT_0498507 [Aspergillus ochraceoroseus IBT 24754]